jgi:hypothetical protein
MFSRQHYQKFAEILKKMHGKDQEMLATELITMFKQDNPRFNAEMFAKAAGLEGNTRLHNVIYAHEGVVKEGTVSKALFDKAKHKGDVYCSHCAGTGKEPPHKTEDCFQCDGKGYLTMKDLKRLEKDRVRVEESTGTMKLMELLPAHEGNADIISVLDDLRDELEEMEFSGDEEWSKALNDFDKWGKKYKYKTATLLNTLNKLRSAFWMGVRKAVDAEENKLRG